MTPQQLASVILEAARIREESWVEDDFGGQIPPLQIATGEYRIFLPDAIQQAVRAEGIDKNFWYPILLAFHCWNDLLAWAERIKKGIEVDEMFGPLLREKQLEEEER